MSLEATLATWELGKDLVSPFEKLILLSLARRCGEEHECWPSVKRMCEDTGIDRKHIISGRQKLIEKGLLIYTGEMRGRSKQIPVMKLLYVDHWEKKRNSPRLNDETESTEIKSTEIKSTSTGTGIRTSTGTGTLNIKEEKVSNILKPFVDSSKSTSGDSYKDDVLFMYFYNRYPNKQKPQVAYKAFLKLKADNEFTHMLCMDVTNRMNNNWKGRDKSKIPFPATYLNGREWEGEIYENTAAVPVKQQSSNTNDTSWGENFYTNNELGF